MTLTLTSGSVLAGSPVVAQIVTDALTVDYAFFRALLKVEVRRDMDDASTEFMLTQPCVPGKAVQMDIHSCLMAIVGRDTEVPITAAGARSYYSYFVKLTAYVNYLSGGVEVTSQGVAYNGGDEICFVRGKWRDIDRMGEDTLDVERLSDKPLTPEYVRPGQMVIVPQSPTLAWQFPADDPDNPPVPQVIAQLVANSFAGGTILGRPFLLSEDNSRDRLDLQFINHYGVHESVSVLAANDPTNPMSHVSSEVTREEYAVVPKSGFGNITRHGVRVVSDITTVALVTDWLTYEWAEWFKHEVLTAEQSWLRIGSYWVACRLLTDGAVVTESGTRIAFKAVLGVEGKVL